ncbi:MAG TPA: trans-aconitate 2-methyltransferase [Dongiaceae bacterium]|jgi:trans-aconitate 2-methyltransferase|nr:trans-aconitate 2-methyltransferase [Dongiaceae bacterium]
MTLDVWNPAQYHRFTDARLRPAIDLLARIALEEPGAVFDLGCGSGRTAGLLARRWPKARIIGVDSSAKMLAAARKDYPGIEFIQADLAGWSPSAAADLLFSNATLQWLDGHAQLFPRLLGLVKPGGVLAIQMPQNHDQPSHRAMIAAAEAGPWAKKLRPVLRPSPVSDPADYYAILAPKAAQLDIWQTTYLQQLEGDNPVAEWTKGTALSPLLAALEEPDRSAFESAYRVLVAKAYPAESDGKTLFPFRRLFIVARRSDG